jgi:hypothetical protein
MVQAATPLPGSREGRGLDHSVARRTGIIDQRRSTCSRCHFGIFVWQPTQWSRDPMGLVHLDCPEPLGGLVAGLASEQGGEAP